MRQITERWIKEIKFLLKFDYAEKEASELVNHL